MRYTLTVDLDNDAFDPERAYLGPAPALMCILREVAMELSTTGEVRPRPLSDNNGNEVGRVSVAKTK